MTAIDLNCDMGEGFGLYRIGDDDTMLRLVSSANIACGFHAGDPHTMFETLSRAKALGVQAGAHPGFNDLPGFGRRAISGQSPQTIEREIIYQIGALAALARAAGTEIRHVKVHGALANMAAEEKDLAEAIARAIHVFDPSLIFVVMPGMETERAGAKYRLAMAREIYADRAYADNGNLLSRKLEGAVIHDPEVAAERVVRMIADREIVCASGKRISAVFETVCVHSDTPGAAALAGILRARLEQAGIEIRPTASLVAAPT